ncbi:Exostoses (Multiple)-like 3 [Physocladia obscura]|uniref:Exostoses (Multiple)-like 3 n=1 Tax=Physocladia obscura TaxID=109957 RepID=A0AAD5T1Y2_9FUNG|nr:Exostoses (Multiple)-like 3 [Physocladia obscura]
MHVRAFFLEQTQIDYIESLQSQHGPIKRVFDHDRNVSRRDFMMAAWIPETDSQFAIFLDCHTLLSVNFLEYAEQTVSAYLAKKRSGAASKVFGISLHNARFDSVHGVPWNPPILPNSPYLLQFPQTHGMIADPIRWNEFREWYLTANRNPLLPNSRTNRWNTETSFDKHLIKFIYVHGLAMVCSNFRSGKSLISQQEEGLVSLGPSTRNNAVLLNIDTKKNNQTRIFFHKFPAINQLSVVNMYFQPVKSIQDLQNPVNPGSFEKCTLLLSTYDRFETLLDRIYHYELFPHLDRIIVVWNHQTVKPHFTVSKKLFVPTIKFPTSKKRNEDTAMTRGFWRKIPEYQFSIPIHVLPQSKNSLNNRYFPYPQIQTDCMISMDDDFDYPYEHLAYGVSLFQGDFFNHAVGFKHMGRSHKRKADGTLQYSTNIENGTSILLPTGLVFHRKYLSMYTSALPQQIRNLVDSVMNGEDIVFNLMVSNATQSCPAVVNLTAPGIQMPGLWNKPKHFETRSQCLDQVVKEFFGGVNPLRFSKRYFQGVDGFGMTPAVEDLECIPLFKI